VTLLVEPVVATPKQVVEEHSPELGELVGRVTEHAEDGCALAGGQSEQPDVVSDGPLKAVGEVGVTAGADELGELLNGCVCDGETGELHDGERTRDESCALLALLARAPGGAVPFGEFERVEPGASVGEERCACFDGTEVAVVECGVDEHLQNNDVVFEVFPQMLGGFGHAVDVTAATAVKRAGAP